MFWCPPSSLDELLNILVHPVKWFLTVIFFRKTSQHTLQYLKVFRCMFQICTCLQSKHKNGIFIPVQVDVLKHQPALYWNTFSPALMNESSQYSTTTVLHAYLCDYNCFSVTLMKTSLHSCTLANVLSIFWIILIYFCYWCQCLDLFPIRRGIYHTSNLHSLPAKRRKERRGVRDV